MTPEGKVKKQIKAVLDRHRCYYFMPVQNGMGAPGLDFHCTVPGGMSLNIEAKAPGKKPTARQLLTMEAMRSAGAYTIVVDGTEASLVALDELIGMLKHD